jgi:hypothetical protein
LASQWILFGSDCTDFDLCGEEKLHLDTRPALILLWMFALYPILAQSLFEASERHRYGALPIMALFAAMAFCWPVESARETGKQ